jgi:hypothetical protein
MLPVEFLRLGFSISLQIDADVVRCTHSACPTACHTKPCHPTNVSQVSMGPLDLDELSSVLSTADVAFVPEMRGNAVANGGRGARGRYSAYTYFNSGVVAYNNWGWSRGRWDSVYRAYYAARRVPRRWADHVTKGDQGLLVCMVKELSEGLSGCNGTYPRFRAGPPPEALHDKLSVQLAATLRMAKARRRKLRVGWLSERWNVLCWQGLTPSGCTGLWRECTFNLSAQTIFYHFCHCARPSLPPSQVHCNADMRTAKSRSPFRPERFLYIGVGLDVCQKVWMTGWFRERAADAGSRGPCDAAATLALHRNAFLRLEAQLWRSPRFLPVAHDGNCKDDV